MFKLAFILLKATLGSIQKVRHSQSDIFDPLRLCQTLSLFSPIPTAESPYSVRMRENTNQKKAPYLNTFHAVPPPLVSLRSEKLWHETKKVKNTKK